MQVRMYIKKRDKSAGESRRGTGMQEKDGDNLGLWGRRRD